MQTTSYITLTGWLEAMRKSSDAAATLQVVSRVCKALPGGNVQKQIQQETVPGQNMLAEGLKC